MIVVIMGTTGAGKTTIGRLLALRMGWTFADADDFHSAKNIEKMRQGIPLTDADRGPWLHAMREQILLWMAARVNGVLACSALKRSYRAELLIPEDGAQNASGEVHLVYLKGSAELIAARIHNRTGHFAGEKLLSSQFATLEEPAGAIVVDISLSPSEIVDEITRRLPVV